MSLLAAICPNCSGPLQVNGKEGVTTCPYCKTQFYNEQAINNFTYNIGNIANVERMVVQSSDSIDQKITNADAYLEQMQDYDGAIEKYKEITEIAGNRYEGWWGLARAYTRNFQDTNCGSHIYKLASDYARRASNVATPEKKQEILTTWDVYRQNYEGHVQEVHQRIDYISSQKKNAEEPYKQQQNDINLQIDNIKNNIDKMELRQKIYNICIKVSICAAILFGVVSLYYEIKYINYLKQKFPEEVLETLSIADTISPSLKTYGSIILLCLCVMFVLMVIRLIVGKRIVYCKKKANKKYYEGKGIRKQREQKTSSFTNEINNLINELEKGDYGHQMNEQIRNI